MNAPRKHHYLPQFYLRGFSVDGQGLYQFHKLSGHVNGAAIRDLAAIRDFHQIDSEGVADPYALERHLARLEGEQATHLRDVMALGPWDARTRQEAIDFVSMMRVRVPAMKRHIQETYGLGLRSVAEFLEKQGRLPKVPVGYEKKLAIKNLIFTVMNWKYLEKMIALGTDRTTRELLASMRLTIYKAPFGCAFITSDQPVGIYHPLATPTTGIGFATPGVEVSFPQSARSLLLLDHSKGRDRIIIAEEQEVSEFNRRTAIMAERYIFAGDDLEKTRRQVSSCAHQFAGLRLARRSIRGGFVHEFHAVAVGPAT